MNRGSGRPMRTERDGRHDRGAPRASRDRDSTLGKRSHDERSDRRHADSSGGAPGSQQLHFRMLVGLRKAGCVIGKGGDFIQLTRKMTSAKVAVDKPVAGAEDRLVHVEGPDEPGRELPGIQDAVLRTAERILGDESPEDGSIQLPHKCHLRMLLFKFQIGMVMGRRGSTINEMRSKSSATIKLMSPANGVPVVPCALPDDEMIVIAGTPDQTLTALKMITDKLRAASAGPDHPPHQDFDRGSPGEKRSRGDGPTSGFGPGPGLHPAGNHLGPPGPGPSGAPPTNVISMALPFQARNALDNNDSVKTEGLTGLATVEYRFLVPHKRSGVILGNKGGMINEIRNRTGARVNLFDDEFNCGERQLQIMSTEDVQDQHCAAFDAAMDCVQALLHDELANEPSGTVRIILPHGQVGAVMGKRGATIKELRSLSGASLQLNGPPHVPPCVQKGEEVLEIRGPRNPVLLATHVVLVAVRGNMARGQLIYKYPLPQGAPPPTPHGPPAGHAALGPGSGGPAHSMPPGGGEGGRHRSRWDSAEPRRGSDPNLHAPLQAPTGPPGAVPVPVPVPGAGQVPGGPNIVYAQGPPPDAAGVPQAPHQVQYVQGLPPAQAGAPPAQVHYVQGPPPGQQHQPVPGQSQVVVYTSQPPPGSSYSQQVPVVQQQQQPGPQQQPQQQPVYVQQQGAPMGQPQPQPGGPPGSQVVEYLQGNSANTYVHQAHQAPPPVSGQQTVVYTSAPGQAPQYHMDHSTQQPVVQPQPQPQQGMAPSTTTTVVHGHPPQQVTYVYTQAPPPGATVLTAPPDAAAVGPQAAVAASGPPSGYGGLASILAAAAAPQAAAAPAVAAPPPAPKARVLLTQEQVVKLRLSDPLQTAKLSALSGATITLSEHILENGAREVLLAGSDAECNTATNLMEALMRSS